MGFMILDDDAIVAILALCDLDRIVALRLTCHRILAISRGRIVWLNAYQRYYELYPHQAPDWDPPLSIYTPEELEETVTKLYRLERNWRSDTPVARSTRAFEVPLTNIMEPSCFSLFPGGRWIIAFERYSGRVTAYDAESPGFPADVLVDSSNEAGEETIQLSDPIHRTASTAQFGILLVSVRSENRFLSSIARKFSFWHIAVEGTCRADLKLKATHSWTTNAPPSQFYGFNNTDGEVLAQVSDVSIDLLQRSGSSMNQSASLGIDDNPDGEMLDIALLPHDRIGVVYHDHLDIFDLPPFTPIHPSHSSRRNPQIDQGLPLRRIDFRYPGDRARLGVASPRIIRNKIAVVIYPVLHLFDPDADDSHVSYRLAYLVEPMPQFALGSYRFLMTRHDRAGGFQASAISYGPKERGFHERDINDSAGGPWQGITDGVPERFDQQSGRVITWVGNDGRLFVHVVDFA